MERQVTSNGGAAQIQALLRLMRPIVFRKFVRRAATPSNGMANVTTFQSYQIKYRNPVIRLRIKSITPIAFDNFTPRFAAGVNAKAVPAFSNDDTTFIEGPIIGSKLMNKARSWPGHR